MKQTIEWQQFADAATLGISAADLILRLAREAIDRRDAFHIVLAGGETPRRTYERLAAAEADWTKWHIYFGDERCLPVADADRNDHMAREAWLDHVAIPEEQIHTIPAELGPDEAAVRYRIALASVPKFDLVVLGLGEDGHTASLFPGNPLGAEPDSPAILAVHNTPKAPAERVTLSSNRLSRTRHVLFLVSGATKRAAMTAWRDGADVPAATISARERVTVFADRAAWPEDKKQDDSA